MRLCRRFASHLLLGTLTLGTALAVGAEPAGGGDLTELPDIEVVVTASRTETESAHVAAPITVYNAKDIQQMSADTVGDVLRYVPGLTPRMYGGRGAVSSLGIRGSTSEQVLVLVDGRRLNRTQGGGVDFSDLPVEFVDRLEVLRGGASAVYGADALGGVINILTKKHAGEPRTSLSAGMGAWGAKRFTLETAGQGRGGSSTLLFQREMNDGDFPYADTRGQAAHRTNADFNGTNLQLSLERPTGGDSRFRLQVARDAVRKGVPGRLEFPTPRARQEDGQWVFDASEHLALSQTHALDFRVYRVRQRMQYDQPDGFATFADHRNQRDALEIRGDLWPTWGQLTYGWDHSRAQLESTTDGNRSRTSDGLYALAQVRRGPWTFTPGARLDGHSDFGRKVSPQLGLVYAPDPGRRARTRWAKSFRAPAFDDLYWPTDAFAQGNPNLRPERGTSLDAGFDRYLRAGRLGVSVFLNDTDDLIVWQPGAGGKWSPQNVGRVRATGVELEGEYRLGPAWRLAANYTFLEAEDRSGQPNVDGKQLIGRPRHAASLRASYERDRWSAALTGTYTGKHFTTAANTQSLPGNEVFDLMGRYQLRAATEVRMEVRNLFDKAYQNQLDYPTPGREWRLSLNQTF